MTGDSNVHVIAQPLLDDSDSKKIYKTISKAVKSKKVFYGSKTVNKMIRKGTAGFKKLI
jgi:ribosomal protein L7Ae-like RNA K-turn-binding protein